MTTPKPKPPPMRCRACTAPYRTCAALMRLHAAAEAAGRSMAPHAGCCSQCTHRIPEGPIPKGIPGLTGKRRRGQQGRALYLAWRNRTPTTDTTTSTTTHTERTP